MPTKIVSSEIIISSNPTTKDMLDNLEKKNHDTPRFGFSMNPVETSTPPKK